MDEQAQKISMTVLDTDELHVSPEMEHAAVMRYRAEVIVGPSGFMSNPRKCNVKVVVQPHLSPNGVELYRDGVVVWKSGE